MTLLNLLLLPVDASTKRRLLLFVCVCLCFFVIALIAFSFGALKELLVAYNRTYTIYVRVCIQAYNFGIFIVTHSYSYSFSYSLPFSFPVSLYICTEAYIETVFCCCLCCCCYCCCCATTHFKIKCVLYPCTQTILLSTIANSEVYFHDAENEYLAILG